MYSAFVAWGGDTLNSRREASPLVRLVAGDEREKGEEEKNKKNILQLAGNFITSIIQRCSESRKGRLVELNSFEISGVVALEGQDLPGLSLRDLRCWGQEVSLTHDTLPLSHWASTLAELPMRNLGQCENENNFEPS
ncbi:hypothetical protein TNCV_4695361 [Trichonephila clavipes]|nr:hypothetical protein TNCV_4695361 [Trichonephila clavipes]